MAETERPRNVLVDLPGKPHTNAIPMGRAERVYSRLVASAPTSTTDYSHNSAQAAWSAEHGRITGTQTNLKYAGIPFEEGREVLRKVYVINATRIQKIVDSLTMFHSKAVMAVNYSPTANENISDPQLPKYPSETPGNAPVSAILDLEGDALQQLQADATGYRDIARILKRRNTKRRTS